MTIIQRPVQRGWSTPLHRASERGRVNVARLLIEHGADVSAKDKEQPTPLHWALKLSHADLAKLLIEHVADISAKDEYGHTPLQWASFGGHGPCLLHE